MGVGTGAAVVSDMGIVVTLAARRNMGVRAIVAASNRLAA